MPLPTMVRRIAPWLFVAAGSAAVGAYVAVDHAVVDLALYELIAWGACAALAAGLLAAGPARPAGWLLLLASQVAWASGDAVWDVLDARGEVPFPGPPDVLYLVGYGLLAAALVAMARGLERPPGLGDAIDAALVAVAATALGWPWIVEPHLEEGRTLAVAVTIAYPLCDIVFLALLVRLFLRPGPRPAAVWLVGASIAVVLLSDVAYAAPVLTGAYDVGTWRDAGWLAGYVLVGAAGLHPSLTAPRGETTSRESRLGRLLAITSALFALPAAVLADALLDEVDRADAVVFASLALAGGTLVVARAGHLLFEAERLRRAAEASERRFRTVFDSAGVGITIGPDGRLDETNEAFQRMLGYSAAELVGRHYLDVTHPDDRERDVGPSLEVYEGGRASYTVEKRYLRRDGTTLWANVTVTRARDGDFGIAVIEDVTRRRELEEELRQAQKMEAVGQLAGGVAHDFNNLLMAISGYAELALRRLPPGEPARADVAEVARAADRAAQLTQQLLAFSRRQVLRAEAVDLNAAVVSAGSLLRRLIGTDVELVTDLAPGLPPVHADPAQLEQIVVNLAVNARDAMPEGGRLALTTRAVELAPGDAAARELPVGAYVVLEVTDTGHGMDEATLARAFEPFFSTKPPGQGSGLGLSMVYGAVRQSGGSAEIESAPGAGTCVRIFLPEAQAADGGAREPGRDAGDVRAGTPPARILLVEDEPVVAALVREVLEEAGHEVVHAEDGRRGLALADSAGPFDLLVTDLVMPHVSGRRVAEELVARSPGAAVVFMSGYPGEEVVARGLLDPGTPYLQKPFALGDLRDRVASLLAARVPA